MKCLNFINGVSNFPAIFLIKSSIIRGDYLTAWIVCNAGIASMVSHFAENHKHNLPGMFGTTKQWSYILNRVDVIYAILTGLRFCYIYYYRYGFNPKYFIGNKVFTLLLCLSLFMNIISERFPLVVNNPTVFTITHSAWHISIFMLLRHFIEFP